DLVEFADFLDCPLLDQVLGVQLGCAPDAPERDMFAGDLFTGPLHRSALRLRRDFRRRRLRGPTGRDDLWCLAALLAGHLNGPVTHCGLGSTYFFALGGDWTGLRIAHARDLG